MKCFGSNFAIPRTSAFLKEIFGVFSFPKYKQRIILNFLKRTLAPGIALKYVNFLKSKPIEIECQNVEKNKRLAINCRGKPFLVVTVECIS